MKTYNNLTKLTTKLTRELKDSTVNTFENTSQLKEFTQRCHTYSTLLVDIESNSKFFELEPELIKSLDYPKRKMLNDLFLSDQRKANEMLIDLYQLLNEMAFMPHKYHYQLQNILENSSLLLQDKNGDLDYQSGKKLQFSD